MTKVLHVVVSDFLVFSLKYDSSLTNGMKTYCTPHQVLNQYSSTNIESIQNAASFPPTSPIATPISVSLKQVETSWYYNQCAINYNKSTDFYVKVAYKHSKPYDTVNKVDAGNLGIVTGTIPKELLYNISGVGDTLSDVNFWKVYGSSDTISIKILNAGLMQGTNNIYLRNLYLYQEYIPSAIKIQHL